MKDVLTDTQRRQCTLGAKCYRKEFGKVEQSCPPGKCAAMLASIDDEAALDVKAEASLDLSAISMLQRAAEHMQARAATYDKPEGERSMRATVIAFNAITGRDLQESEGWLLLQLLKDVRDRQRDVPHRDSLEDCVAYAALKAEARLLGN